MKLFALAFSLLTINAAAALDICALPSTQGIEQQVTITSETTENYTHAERMLILQVMRKDSWRVVRDEYDAAWQFNDYEKCAPFYERGPDAGSVKYFVGVTGERIALVHFSRNGFETGAFFRQNSQSRFVEAASIENGKITCR